jgi:hypothetical protein
MAEFLWVRQQLEEPEPGELVDLAAGVPPMREFTAPSVFAAPAETGVGTTDLYKHTGLRAALLKSYTSEQKLSEYPDLSNNKYMQLCTFAEIPCNASKAAAGGVNSDLAPQPKRSLVDQIRYDGVRTFVLKDLSVTMTTPELISDLEQLGCADFDFLRMPVSNDMMQFRGFAVIGYSTVKAAVRFVHAAEGRIFAGASERAIVDIAFIQGVMPNLDAIRFNRRRRKIAHLCDRRGFGVNGSAIVRLRGQLRTISSTRDVEAARAVFG